MMRILRLLLGIALVLVGILSCWMSLGYLPAGFGGTLALVRLLAILAVPAGLIALGVGVILQAWWAPLVGAATFAVNLALVDFSFVPFLGALRSHLPAQAFVRILFVHIVNLSVVLLAIWTAQRGKPRRRESPLARLAYLRSLWPARIAFLIAAVAAILLPISYVAPFSITGRLANVLTREHLIDVLAVGKGGVQTRAYHTSYFAHEPFQIEVFAGGMTGPVATDPDKFGPLAWEARGLGFALGSETAVHNYRADIVHDLTIPLWALVVTPAAAGLLLRRRRMQAGEAQAVATAPGASSAAVTVDVPVAANSAVPQTSRQAAASHKFEFITLGVVLLGIAIALLLAALRASNPRNAQHRYAVYKGMSIEGYKLEGEETYREIHIDEPESARLYVQTPDKKVYLLRDFVPSVADPYFDSEEKSDSREDPNFPEDRLSYGGSVNDLLAYRAGRLGHASFFLDSHGFAFGVSPEGPFVKLPFGEETLEKVFGEPDSWKAAGP